MKLHLGCGTVLLDGWTNADAWVPDCVSLIWNRLTREDDQGQPRIWVEPKQTNPATTLFVKLREAQDLSIFPAGTMDEIYSSHWLEHFHPQTAYELMGEFQRILKPGGTMHHITPDFDSLIQLWQSMHQEWNLEHPVQDLSEEGVAYSDELQKRCAEAKEKYQSTLIYDYERYNTIVNGVLCPFQFSANYPQHKSLWGKHFATFLLKRWGFENVLAEVKGTDLHIRATNPQGIYNTIRV